MMISWRISGVPRMIQTMTLVRADRGRSWESQRAKPRASCCPEGRPLAHGAESHYQTKGQREQQRQEKQLDRLTTALQDGEGNSPEHEKILLYVVIMGGTKGEEGKRMREICRSKAESDRSLPLLYDLRNYLVTMT